jgi:hypothetical protein
VLSQSDMYTLAIGQGLPPEKAKIAAAVGMGESGGEPTKHNTNRLTADDSYGLWQINMLGPLGPERRAKYGLTSDAQLFDPTVNARVMKGESNNGQNWIPWGAYNNGSYLKFMDNHVIEKWVSDGGSTDQSLLDKLNPVSAAQDAAGKLGSIVETVNKAAKWVSNSQNWVRVGYVVGGSVLVVAGLVMVLESTSVGKAATNLVPTGRVLNLAKTVAKGKS